MVKPHGDKKKRLLARLHEAQGGECYWCQLPIEVDVPIYDGRVPCDYPTLDHLVPLDSGGTWVKSNLVLACWRCNHIKSNGLIPDEFMDDPERLAVLFRSGDIKFHLIRPEACAA